MTTYRYIANKGGGGVIALLHGPMSIVDLSKEPAVTQVNDEEVGTILLNIGFHYSNEKTSELLKKAGLNVIEWGVQQDPISERFVNAINYRGTPEEAIVAAEKYASMVKQPGNWQEIDLSNPPPQRTP